MPNIGNVTQQVVVTTPPGESLQSAFVKINDNFANVWAAGPVGSNVRIANNSINTLNTNGGLVLNPNGIGNVVANAHVIPDQTRVRNLGSTTFVWNTLYTLYGNIQYATITNATIANATISNIGNVTIGVANLHITGGTNGYVLQTDGTGNLTWTAQSGGGVPGGANTQVQYNDAGAFGGTAGFTFDNTSNTLSAVKINTTDVFNSNGIVLENSDLTQGATAAVVIPTNGSSDPIQLNNTYGNIALQTGAGSGITAGWSFNNHGNLQLPDAGVLWNNGGLTTLQAGNNGAQIGSNDGQSYVIANVNGTYMQTLADTTNSLWHFGTDGNLSLPYGNLAGLGNVVGPGNIAYPFGPGPTLLADNSANNSAYFSLTAVANATGVLGYMGAANFGGNAATGLVYTTDGTGNSHSWYFQNDGTTVFPNYTFPNVDGTAGQVFATYGNGSIYWANAATPYANTVGSFGSDMGIGPNYAGNDPAVLFSNDDMVIRTGGTATVGYPNSGQIDIAANEVLNIGLSNSLVDATYVSSYVSNLHFDGTGNITLNTNTNGNYSWTYGTDGELTLPSGGRLGFAGKGWTGLDGGNGNPVSLTSLYSSGMYSSCITLNPNGSLDISTYGDGTGQTGNWNFNDRVLTLPTSVGSYKNQLYTNGAERTILEAWNGDFVTQGNGTSLTLNSIDSRLVLQAQPGIEWLFDASGALTLPSATGPAGVIQTANAYPTLLAYGSGGHGGPEMDWMNANNPANTFNSSSTLRHTMFLNGDGFYIGLNENNVANVFRGHWQFGTDGNLTLPGAIGFSNSSAVIQSIGPVLQIAGNIQTNQNTLGLPVDGGDTFLSANANVNLQSGIGGTNYEWSFGVDGNLHTPQGGWIGPAGVKGDGTMLTGGKGNIASLTSYYANVDALNYSSCVTVNADGTLNITTYGDGTGLIGSWVFDNTGNLTLPDVANVSINYANGNPYGGGSYGNSNVATFLAAYGSNTVSTTGNISSGNLITGGAISSTGNVQAGNVRTAGQVSAAGNVTTAGNFVGNGAALTNVTVSVAGNVIGTQSNVGIVAGSYTWTFNNTGVATFPGTVYSNALTNGTAFAVGNGAVSNCALSMTPTAGTAGNYAIRDYSTANSVMYFDTTIGSANTGGSFQFRSSNAYTVLATINTYGVSQPTKPGFRVYGNGVISGLNVTTNGNGVLNGNNWAVDYNQGSYLNSTTGVFIAPAAGLYQVNLVARVANNTAGASQAVVIKNAGTTPVNQLMWEVAANCTTNHFGVGTVSKLAVGDTLTLKVAQGNVTFDANDNWSVAFIG
jgi:hypothetical protein